MHRGLTAAATNVKQTQDRLAEGFLENEFADDQQAHIQEQDAGESQHTGTGHTDAQGIAAANAGKQTQDSLAAGILAGEILAGDNQCNTNADTAAGNDTQRAADANGQGTAGGIGDKTKQERGAIVGSVVFLVRWW